MMKMYNGEIFKIGTRQDQGGYPNINTYIPLKSYLLLAWHEHHWCWLCQASNREWYHISETPGQLTEAW